MKVLCGCFCLIWLWPLIAIIKKERRTIHTAIALHLLKKEIQLNEICLGHKDALCLLDGGHDTHYETSKLI